MKPHDARDIVDLHFHHGEIGMAAAKKNTRAPSASSASASWAARSPKISPRAGWRVIGYDISAGAPPRSGPRRRRDRRAAPPTSPSQAPTILTSLPKPQALMDTVRAIAAAKLPRACSSR